MVPDGTVYQWHSDLRQAQSTIDRKSPRVSTTIELSIGGRVYQSGLVSMVIMPLKFSPDLQHDFKASFVLFSQQFFLLVDIHSSVSLDFFVFAPFFDSAPCHKQSRDSIQARSALGMFLAVQ